MTFFAVVLINPLKKYAFYKMFSLHVSSFEVKVINTRPRFSLHWSPLCCLGSAGWPLPLSTAVCWCTSYLLQVRRQPLVQLLQSHFLSGQTEAPAAVRSRRTCSRTRAVLHRTRSSVVDVVTSRCTRCSPRMKKLPRHHHSLVFTCIASRIICPAPRAQLPHI